MEVSFSSGFQKKDKGMAEAVVRFCTKYAISIANHYVKDGLTFNSLDEINDFIKPYVEKTLWKEEANLNYYSGVYRKQELGRNGKWVYSPCGYCGCRCSLPRRHDRAWT